MIAVMMSTRTWGLVIAGVLSAIVLIVGYLAASRAPSGLSYSQSPVTSTPSKPVEVSSGSEQLAPLSSQVFVTSPQENAHVGHSFTVAGLAPGPWFFEAQFPIMVRAADGTTIGHATGKAQGEWMTDKQVTFTSIMQLDATYHGAATLVLLKDNPSGLPENDDSVEIPIIVD